jgi:histidine triad (HIT) family protein
MSECIFCRIIAGDVPARVVHSDDEVVAFRDIDPKAPTHVLVVPRRHIASVTALEPDDAELVGRMVVVATRAARVEGIDGSGYRLVMNAGGDGGQSVDHVHLHLLGGRRLTWPPG